MKTVSRLQVHIVPLVLVCLRYEFLALSAQLAVEVILNIIIILSAFHHFTLLINYILFNYYANISI